MLGSVYERDYVTVAREADERDRFHSRAELEAFLRTTPFRLPLDATPLDLSAGEKQKLEILKQLFLKPRLLILDEPTSVLTPQEADEVLGALRERAPVRPAS